MDHAFSSLTFIYDRDFLYFVLMAEKTGANLYLKTITQKEVPTKQ
jgi:hypothetical protein